MCSGLSYQGLLGIESLEYESTLSNLWRKVIEYITILNEANNDNVYVVDLIICTYFLSSKLIVSWEVTVSLSVNFITNRVRCLFQLEKKMYKAFRSQATWSREASIEMKLLSYWSLNNFLCKQRDSSRLHPIKTNALLEFFLKDIKVSTESIENK